MPLDPVMARGIAPLGAGLADTMYQIGQLKRQDANTAEFGRRTDLLEQSAQQEALSAEKQAELRREYGEVVKYSQASPEIQEAYIAQLRMRDPDFANSPFANAPAGEALKAMRAGMEAMLGERQQAVEAPKRDIRQLPGGSLVEVPAEGDPRVVFQAQQEPQQPQTYAPTSDMQNWRFRNSLPPDQQALWDKMHGSKGAAGDAPVSPERTERRAEDAQNVLTAIDEAKGLISKWSAGFVGQKLRDQGGTPAFDLNAKINTVKANIGFDRLQRMREESKTGGALGQVAVQELEMLQSVITSLDTAQSPEQLTRALDAVAAQYTKAMGAYQAAQQERQGGTAPTADPLAQYAGRTIKQGDKRYQVIQGADGKYFAQELK